MHSKAMKAVGDALESALDRLDDSAVWLGQVGGNQPWAADGDTVQSMKALEQEMEAFFRRQRNEYTRLLTASPVEKAGDGKDGPEDAARFLERAKRLLAAGGASYIAGLQKLFRKWSGPLFKTVVLTVCASIKGGESPTGLTKRAVKWLDQHTIRFAKEVQQTTHDAVIAALSRAVKEGKGISEMGETLRGLPEFNWTRARLVARTETISAANAATLEGYRQSNVVTGKEWMCANNERSRAAHKAADGQKKPLDEPFIVGGYKMMHPGDGSLGAPAREVCNCRCGMRPVLRGEKTGKD